MFALTTAATARPSARSASIRSGEGRSEVERLSNDKTALLEAGPKEPEATARTGWLAPSILSHR
jgi:hypothetical protein